ncbi:MAG: hypothetical protein R2765_02685 [Ferruginibacter sp.]|nr:hypothetical protein [Bacteroidota bacterium]MBX2918262.1 hypothetical protein [Ferruginibacter sp.]MCB0708115.1 hypothetical protein [Chitinophagaceae bacterium]
MKKTIKLKKIAALLFFIGCSFSGFTQTIKEFFNTTETPLTYLGIDYYKARLINDPGSNNTSDIKNRLFNSMNQVVVAEPKNYNITGAFNRSNTVTNDLDAVTERNEKTNADNIASNDPADFSRLTENDIAAEAKALNLKGKSGVGLVFIMEGMKKEEKKSYGSVWVVLLDMKTKKVLMAERLEQEAAGFGFRNFWVSIIKKSIVEINKKKYKDWKEKYGG